MIVMYVCYVMLYLIICPQFMKISVSHVEWCFSQTELMASLGNVSALETSQLYEGRSLRQICLIYMALINTGEKYADIFRTELSNACSVCNM
jgi:hypothetical protein